MLCGSEQQSHRVTTPNQYPLDRVIDRNDVRNHVSQTQWMCVPNPIQFSQGDGSSGGSKICGGSGGGCSSPQCAAPSLIRTPVLYRRPSKVMVNTKA